MKKRLLIITTCGTSLFTNNSTDEDRKWLNTHANHTLSEIDTSRLEQISEQRRQKVIQTDEPNLRRLSAEINGLHALIKRDCPKETQHLLVHSDTAIGRQTALLVQETLSERYQFNADMTTAGGLRTNDADNFRGAVSELIKDLAERLEGYQQAGYEVVFNLTGGFKSLNGLLQAYASASGARSVYLFESSEKLVEIPRLPIALQLDETIEAHFTVLRKVDLSLQTSVMERNAIPDSLIDRVGDEFMGLSIWGNALYLQAKRKLYMQKLWPVLSERIIVNKQVAEFMNKRQPKHVLALNNAFDALCLYHEKQKVPPAAHEIKALAGNPKDCSTHEVYAWSDDIAARLYFHYEGDRIIVDSLGKHL